MRPRLRPLTYIAIFLAIVAIIMSTAALLRPARVVEVITEAPTAQSTQPTVTPQVSFVTWESPQPEASGMVVYYLLTDEDRAIVEAVVTAEAIGEPFDGQKAVAQCILETARKTGKTPGEVATEPGQYATPADPEKVTESVREAVAAIFDDGDLVTEEPIQYFYAPARCKSTWHESLTFVIEIGGHRFFKGE